MDDSGDGKVMTVVEHLSELRRRIFISLLAITIGAIIGFIVTPDAIRILKAPISRPLVLHGAEQRASSSS